jgi:hypothetical protein
MRGFLWVLLVLVGLGLTSLTTGPTEAQIAWTIEPGQLQQKEEEDIDVDQWDDDVLNITTTSPGVILIEAEGTDVTGSDADESLCASGSRDLGTWFANSAGRHSHPVQPGTYQITLDPHGAVTASYRLRVRMFDTCGGPSGDDHGDSAGCATRLCLGSTAEDGEIGSYTVPDEDFFTFYLASAQTVTVESSGLTDVRADLYDEDGAHLASDDDSGTGANFLLVESLPAGRYFLRLLGTASATGSYTVEVD